MDSHIASLLRNCDATTFVIVRDDATTDRKRRPAFQEPETPDENDWQRPASFKNSPNLNPAPIIPSRKASKDDLCLVPTTGNDEVGKQGSFFDRFTIPKFKRWNKKDEGRITTVLEKPNDSTDEDSGEMCSASQEGKKQGKTSSLDHFPAPGYRLRSHFGQQKAAKKDTRSWDESPMAKISDLSEDKSPPTVPARKRSDDNLLEPTSSASVNTSSPPSSSCCSADPQKLDNAGSVSADQSNRRRRRRSSLDNSSLASCDQSSRSRQRRSSVDNSGLSSGDQSNQSSRSRQRRSTTDNSSLTSCDQSSRRRQRTRAQRRPSSDDNKEVSLDDDHPNRVKVAVKKYSEPEPAGANSQPQQRPQRRLSLDNEVLCLDVHTGRHFQRRSSMDNANLASTDQSSRRRRRQRRSSVDNACMPSSATPERTHQPLPPSLDNLSLSLDDHSGRRRRSSIDITGNDHSGRRFQRKSSLDNAMASSEYQTRLRQQRRSSVDNTSSLSGDQKLDQALQRRRRRSIGCDMSITMTASLVTRSNTSENDLRRKVLSNFKLRPQPSLESSTDIFKMDSMHYSGDLQ